MWSEVEEEILLSVDFSGPGYLIIYIPFQKKRSLYSNNIELFQVLKIMKHLVSYMFVKLIL